MFKVEIEFQSSQEWAARRRMLASRLEMKRLLAMESLMLWAIYEYGK